MKKVTYGILSTASIVGRFIQGVRNSENGEVGAICSRSIYKAQQKAREFQIDKAYGDYLEMLNDPDLDVIYIATPNALHYRDALLAIRHHKHVLLEKPFVLTEQQARHLFEEAQKEQVFLMEAQKAPFLPVTIHLKEIIQTKRLGKLRYVNMTSSFPSRFTYEHWMYDLQYGGGCLYGSCSYTTDYLMYLLDSTQVEVQGMQIKAPTGVDEFCQLQMIFDAAIMVSSCISMKVATKNVAVFYFDEGYVEVENYWKARTMKIVKENHEEVVEYPCPYEFVYEVEHVNACILKGALTSSVITPQISIKTMEIMETVFRSWNPDLVRIYE